MPVQREEEEGERGKKRVGEEHEGRFDELEVEEERDEVREDKEEKKGERDQEKEATEEGVEVISTSTLVSRVNVIQVRGHKERFDEFQVVKNEEEKRGGRDEEKERREKRASTSISISRVSGTHMSPRPSSDPCTEMPFVSS